MTSWRELCAEIVRASDAVHHDAAAAEGDFLAAIDNARTTLAQSEAVPPTDSQPKPQWHLLARETPPSGAQCEYVIVTEHGTAEGHGRWQNQDGAIPRPGFYGESGLFVSDPAETIWRLAALAQPGQEGVTNEEWDVIKDRLWRHYETTGYQGERFIYQGDFDTALDAARQELARLARPTIQPVPVAERPWEREGWYDLNGMCWLYLGHEYDGIPRWIYVHFLHATDGEYTHSLPHNALPVPGAVTQPGVNPKTQETP